MKGFTVASQITAIKPLVDRGMSVTFHTKELPAEEQVEVIKYLSSAGWLLFKENEVKEEEIPKADADLNEISPSKRQRNIIWRIWESQGKKEDFNSFYIKFMDRIAEGLKVKYLE